MCAAGNAATSRDSVIERRYHWSSVSEGWRMRSLALMFVALAALAAPAAAQDMDRMATAAFAAAAEGNVRQLTDLVSQGYDVNFQRRGRSALGTAVTFKRPEAVRYLLSRGADPAIMIHEEFVVGQEAPRPLIDYARNSSSPEIVALLEGALGTSPPATRAALAAAPPAAKVAPPAAAGGGGARWDPPGTYSPGQSVLISTNGGLDWRSGKVVQIGSGEFDKTYLVVDGNGQNHYLDWTRVTTTVRQPYWTQQFVGDWALHTGLSSVKRTDGRDRYRVTEGGMRLPPLQIKADGTYSWILTDGKRLQGRWISRPDQPGIVLQKGDKSLDWTVYNSTTLSSLTASGAEEIRLANPAAMGSLGKRIGK